MTVSLAKRARKSNKVAPVATEQHDAHVVAFNANNGTVTDENSASDALVIIATETLDASDVDSVLTMIESDANDDSTVTGDASDESAPTFREVALSFDDATVSATVAKINDAFDKRDAFEASNGLSLSADSSYTRERDKMLNNIACARFFLALNVEPNDVILRQVSSSAMFNAKALKKVRELASFACGYGSKLEKVMQAFIACSLVATDRGVTDITNEINRRFLCSAGFTSLFSDQDLIDYLDSEAHRTMSSGAETQSSQARNVLDVLGLGSIKTVTRARDAITLHADNAFYALFRERFMK